MIEKFILIPEYEVSIDMLNEDRVAPFGQSATAGTWENLRRYNDSGVIKAVVKFDASMGIPKAISDYINENSPTVYNKDELKVVLEPEE